MVVVSGPLKHFVTFKVEVPEEVPKNEKQTIAIESIALKSNYANFLQATLRDARRWRSKLVHLND